MLTVVPAFISLEWCVSGLRALASEGIPPEVDDHLLDPGCAHTLSTDHEALARETRLFNYICITRDSSQLQRYHYQSNFASVPQRRRTSRAPLSHIEMLSSLKPTNAVVDSQASGLADTRVLVVLLEPLHGLLERCIDASRQHCKL